MQVRNRKPDNDLDPLPPIPCGVCGAWTLVAGRHALVRNVMTAEGQKPKLLVTDSWVGCTTCGTGRHARA